MNEINKWLDEVYGRNLSNQPTFRVVWSNDQTEKRFGVFQEHVGTLFLREFRGLREVPKYPHIKAKWVLERWMPPGLCFDPDIPETSGGSYEPIMVFIHENGNPVPVTRTIIEQIIHHLFNPVLPGHGKELLKTSDEREFEKEVELNRLHLEEAGSSLIKDGEAII